MTTGQQEIFLLISAKKPEIVIYEFVFLAFYFGTNAPLVRHG